MNINVAKLTGVRQSALAGQSLGKKHFPLFLSAASNAAAVAAVPYDVVNTDEARALADGNLLSFLRVSRAELELPAGTDPYADEVYKRAAADGRELFPACGFAGSRRLG